MGEVEGMRGQRGGIKEGLVGKGGVGRGGGGFWREEGRPGTGLNCITAGQARLRKRTGGVREERDGGA